MPKGIGYKKRKLATKKRRTSRSKSFKDTGKFSFRMNPKSKTATLTLKAN